jgi:hypothetical protein
MIRAQAVLSKLILTCPHTRWGPLCFHISGCAKLIFLTKLQQELLNARLQLETQANQILSLEAALLARPALPASAPSSEKDKLIAEQAKTIRELEIVVAGYEENLGEPLRAVREDVEKEWLVKVDAAVKKMEEKERWAEELVKQLEKEKKVSCFSLLFQSSVR